MFTSYNFPKLENCIDKQLSQIGNISLVGDRALRAFLARAPRLADPDPTRLEDDERTGQEKWLSTIHEADRHTAGTWPCGYISPGLQSGNPKDFTWTVI